MDTVKTTCRMNKYSKTQAISILANTTIGHQSFIR